MRTLLAVMLVAFATGCSSSEPATKGKASAGAEPTKPAPLNPAEKNATETNPTN